MIWCSFSLNLHTSIFHLQLLPILIEHSTHIQYFSHQPLHNSIMMNVRSDLFPTSRNKLRNRQESREESKDVKPTEVQLLKSKWMREALTGSKRGICTPVVTIEIRNAVECRFLEELSIEEQIEVVQLLYQDQPNAKVSPFDYPSFHPKRKLSQDLLTL